MSRLSISDVGAQLAAFATTGDIQRPLITVAGTMDALLPIDHHARAYARKVAAVAESQDRGQGDGNDKHRPAYRLYEVQNGNHIETFQDVFGQLELIEPHAQRAFDLLVSAGRARRGVAARSVYPARRPNRRYTCAAGTLRKAIRALKARGPAQSGPVRRGLPVACQQQNVSPANCRGDANGASEASFPSRERPNHRSRGYRPLFRRRLSARGGVS